MNTIISIIVIILIIIFIRYFINDYKKSSLSSIKEYINNNLDNIFITLSLLFSLFGFIVMISNLIEFICHLIKNNSGVYNGFAILAFGISLFSIGESIQQTRKSNEETIQFKDDINSKLDEISNKLESLNPLNEDLHGEIEKLKEKNQEIIGLLKEKNLEEFKKEINKNIEAIPQDNLKEPTMYIVGPAIEASKYYYEEAQFKEMFAKLIAASCDDRDNDKISPYFVEAIKQISHKEAMILTLFRDKKTSALPIVNYRLILKTIGEKYYEKYVFIHDNPDNIRKYSDSLINLQRLGLVSLDFQNWLTDNNFYQIYKDNVFFKNTKQEILKNIENPDFECKDFDIQKGILELTPLGKNFIDLCL